MFSFLKKKLEEFIKKTSKKIKESAKKIEEKIRKKIEYIQVKESDIQDFLSELEYNLIQSDCSFKTTQKIIEEIKNNLIGKEVKKKELKNEIKKAIKNSIEKILENKKYDLINEIKKFEKPIDIIFFGFNGCGKTTTIAKIAYLLKKLNYKVLLVAADTFRAGAIEQLEEHAKKLKIEIFKKDYGFDPCAIVYEAKKYALQNGFEILLIDTAGRSHTNKNLMDELSKIVRVNKPKIKILVLDSLTGSDVINQYEFFNKVAQIDAVIFTKVDVNEKGGNILSILYEFNSKIAFLGLGQNYEDLKEFEKEIIIKNIFGKA